MHKLALVIGCLILVACGGGGSSAPVPPVVQPPPVAPAAPDVAVEVGLKQVIFSWAAVSGATHYRLLENPDGHSGFTQVGADIPAGTLSVNLTISIHFQDFTNALYMLEACNTVGCTGSTAVNTMNGMLDAIGYFKASNTDSQDLFGHAIALSADGGTLAVAAPREDSNATGINGDQSDNSEESAGAVYLFRFDGVDWFQQAYVKASNTGGRDGFGGAVALSADGNTLAVGASEDSSATGINGDQSDNSEEGAGAVYLFRFGGVDWFQQAYIKASNTDSLDNFGRAVALSADGNTLAVGASEDSSATGINGDQSDNSEEGAGAVYLFRFDGADWFQRAYVKASNAEEGDGFGGVDSVALSADGNTLAVGAGGEDSSATGINADQSDNSVSASGAAYVFRFDGEDWFQQAYVKASNTDANDGFGRDLALSGNGDTLAVGARNERSNATGINGNQNDNSVTSGAAYVFRFNGTVWFQQAYVKASNNDSDEVLDNFSQGVALSTDGNTLAIGAVGEDSNATGINGDQSDNSALDSGAAYVFRFDGADWFQRAYVKASNTEEGDGFGFNLALSADGETLAIGAYPENSNAIGVNGDQNDNSALDSGAVYLY